MMSHIPVSQPNFENILRYFAMIGSPIGLVGMGLTVFASIRLLRANATERRAIPMSTSSPSDGVWPPSPNRE
jgi:hypothetical protein